jgi:hypothetical protein
LLKLSSLSSLSNIPIVITDHFHKECLGFIFNRLGEHVVLDELDDHFAVAIKSILDLPLVGYEGFSKLGVLWVLLNG